MSGALLAVVGSMVAPATVWSMSGFAAAYTDVGGPSATYSVNVIFRTDATVDVIKGQGSNLNNEVNPYVDPTSEASNTWVRCTHISGDDMTHGHTRGVWNRLSSQAGFEMRYTSSGPDDQISGTFDFELSSDSGGSSIEAQALGTVITVGEIF